MRLSEHEVAEARAVISRALDEDLRYGPDITTQATVARGRDHHGGGGGQRTRDHRGVRRRAARARRGARHGRLPGAGSARRRRRVESGAAVLRLEAGTQGLLTAERTLLNLVCHLSGIASATRQWVDAVAGTRGCRPRHPQDAARSAGVAEVRSAGRRGTEPPDGARRRGADQGQPCRGGRVGGRRVERGQDRCTRPAVRGGGRLPRAARRGACRAGGAGAFWTTCRSGRRRSPCSGATPALQV